jgi:hypothetical protein
MIDWDEEELNLKKEEIEHHKKTIKVLQDCMHEFDTRSGSNIIHSDGSKEKLDCHDLSFRIQEILNYWI